MFTDDSGEEWRTPKENAQYIRSKGGRATEATLATLRSNGKGPPFKKNMGGILYPRSGTDAWMETNKSSLVRSTSELKALKLKG